MRLLLAAVACFAAITAAAAEVPLRAGVVPNSPPFALHDRSGKLTGFSVELMRVIAIRLKRDVAFSEAPMPKLMAELTGGAIDVLPGPVAATPDRAAEVLFTEGYFWSQYQFGARPGLTLASLADLRGKRLAVVEASDYAEWADRNAARHGFLTMKQATLGTVFEAVRTGAADASLTGSQALRAATAGPRPGIVAQLALPETRTHDSMAVRLSDIELRDEIEEALRCLKQEGVVARLATSWLGGTPGAEDLENLVIPGYGVPGLAGYDPKPHKPRCVK